MLRWKGITAAVVKIGNLTPMRQLMLRGAALTEGEIIDLFIALSLKELRPEFDSALKEETVAELKQLHPDCRIQFTQCSLSFWEQR